MSDAVRARKLHFGAKSIGAFLGNEDIPKINRLLRQGLVPGVQKWGRQYVLDEEAHVEEMRARARGVA